jgi:hypothetical protein
VVSANEVRQEPVRAEPPGILRVVNQHGGPRSWTKDSWLAHAGTDEAIDQGRLACPRRAAYDREQRCLDLDESRNNVVVELLDDRVPLCSGYRRVGSLERE